MEHKTPHHDPKHEPAKHAAAPQHTPPRAEHAIDQKKTENAPAPIDPKKLAEDLAKEEATNEMMRQKMQQRAMPQPHPVSGAEQKTATPGLVPLAQASRQYAEHINVFNSQGVGSAINWLLGNGFKLGPIIAVILANLPAILAAIKSGDPAAIITLLLGLLGKSAASAEVPAARIGS